ncbi:MULTISPECIES: hypothetical protein [Haloferax]|uniref:Uncharacterized protein n=1 Tax=Haloferax marinisediminis TaxID=2666142 RepID=A0A6G1Z191_9EURY|nr:MULTISPECIES: hypothetical protein [Haloferax]MRW80359.1 hypothetical protein [Haloferax marinisediminis]
MRRLASHEPSFADAHEDSFFEEGETEPPSRFLTGDSRVAREERVA